MIELTGGAGVVRRDDGEIIITKDVSGDRGQTLRRGDHRPVEIWLEGDRSLVGGLLPPGAVSAEVIDDRGARVAANIAGGAYAAILEQPNDGHGPIVCCRDEGGAPVRRPLPADYPSEPVDDAEEPCPACGAVDYDECVPSESGRGGRPGPGDMISPDPIVVCRVCGHEEREGVFYAADVSPDDTEDEAAREARIACALAHARTQRWYSETMTLRAVTFPIYAAERWSALIGGSGSHRDRLTSLTISHYDTPDADPYGGARPRLEITTSTDDSYRPGELREGQRILHSWLQNDDPISRWPDASNAARTVWLAARGRELRRKVLDATRSEQLITIDGTPEPFLTLTTPADRWVAIRRHHRLTITVSGHKVDATTITLEPVPDPAARLLRPEPEDR
jgi:hypothetical protein